MPFQLQISVLTFGAPRAAVKTMLKISTMCRKNTHLLILEGKLVPPWTKELKEAACQAPRAGHPLIIDVQGVTDISTDGEEALYCLMLQGAQFHGGGVFIKEVLKQLAQRARQNDLLRNAQVPPAIQ